MPAQPLEGAHEIQSFCLGHTAFACASAFVKHGDQASDGGSDGCCCCCGAACQLQTGLRG